MAAFFLLFSKMFWYIAKTNAQMFSIPKYELLLFFNLLCHKIWMRLDLTVILQVCDLIFLFLQVYASQYFPQISELLRRLPRVILLMLKTNDCIRAVNYSLVSSLYHIEWEEKWFLTHYQVLDACSWKLLASLKVVMQNLLVVVQSPNISCSWPIFTSWCFHRYASKYPLFAVALYPTRYLIKLFILCNFCDTSQSDFCYADEKFSQSKR